MHFQNEFKTLYSKIEKLSKANQHHIVDEAKFTTLKKEIMEILKTLFGETSREYRIVRFTKSPETVFKVMNHIAARTETLTSINIAVNI